MNLIPQNNALINARIVEKDSLWSEGIDQTYSLQLCAISGIITGSLSLRRDKVTFIFHIVVSLLYLAWEPIQNHATASPLSSPNARYLRPTRAGHNLIIFLNFKEGCVESIFRSRKFLSSSF